MGLVALIRNGGGGVWEGLGVVLLEGIETYSVLLIGPTWGQRRAATDILADMALWAALAALAIASRAGRVWVLKDTSQVVI